MNLRRKKPRPLVRDEGAFRDARLIVIATEDTYAPKHYFGLFHNPRLKVHVLPTEGGESAPEHVLRRLDGYAAEYSLGEDDQLWLMLDTDHWVQPDHVANFSQVCALALAKGYGLAHSNPCFEIWLLLHVVDWNCGMALARCADVESQLRQALGSYSKRKLDPMKFPPDAIHAAVTRARQLDQSPDDRWPQQTGTHVYRIVEAIL